MVTSLPPEALTPYCCRLPVWNGLFTSNGLKVRTVSMAHTPADACVRLHEAPALVTEV